MSTVVYTARRDLVPYHVEGTNYTLTFETMALDPPVGSDIKVKTESLDGSMETLYFGRKRIWSVTTAPLKASSEAAKLLLEFLESTADGHPFTFDPYDDGTDLTVVREDEGYARARFQPIDGPNDYITLSFQVRVS